MRTVTRLYSFSFTILIFLILCQTVSAGDTIRFAVIGDRTSGHVEGVFGKVLSQIELLRPEIIMSVGDYIEGHTEDSLVLDERWHEFMGIVGEVKAPMYFVPGNNDIEYDIQERLFKKYAGDTYYSFDYKNIHFVMLDNSRWESSEALPEEQIAWLKKDLSAGKNAENIMVFMHKPFWYRTLSAGESDLLHDIFVENGVDAVFCGHFHRYFTGEYDGIKYTTVGSSGGGMNPGLSGIGYHFCWVTVDEEGIHIAAIDEGAVREWDDVRAVELREQYTMNIKGVANSSLVISPDLTVSEQPFELSITNYSKNNAIEDTLSWSQTEGWNVSPANVDVSISPGQTQTLTFTASATANAFNSPQVSFAYPYRSGRSYEISHSLSVAREAVCQKARKVHIDGDLKEDCWSNPVSVLLDGNGASTKTELTEFYFAYDEDNFYLAARCHESEMENIVANVTDQDGPIYGEDCVGYFIQMNPDEPSVFQIYINPNGAVFDIKYNPGSDGYMISDYDWNGEYEVKCVKKGTFWTMETRIPLTQFDVKYNTDKDIRLNFRRKQKRLNESGNWQIPIDAQVKSFGILQLR